MKIKFLATFIALIFLAACASATSAQACDSAQFIDHVIVDVPVAQGTLVMPGIHFTKSWQVKNQGTCDWTADYALVQSGGDALGTAEEAALPGLVAAGETVDISVCLTAPAQAGSYRGEWMLRNGEGQLFGVGPNGDRPLTTEFVVAELPEPVVYDFAQVICLAQWYSDRASFLPCEGEDDEQGLLDGYVRLNMEPALESSKRGNPPVIEVKPNNQSGGWIAGFFPPITIEEGDHFLATIGCMASNPQCALLFRLDYELPDGTRATLGEWEQIFDGKVGAINVDLSDLAGDEVRLILAVHENGGRSLQAIGFWLAARVERLN